MKQTLKILFSRWPEVMLIMLFTGGAALLFSQSQSNPNSPQWTIIAVAGGAGIFLVLGYIFQLGFLRTVVIAADQQFQPKELMMIGRPFLGRFIIFGIILMIIVVLLSQITISILISAFTDIDKTTAAVEQLENLPIWIPLTAVLSSMAILIKFWLFIPAIIVAKDCKLKETLAYLRTIRLFKAREVFLWLGVIILIQAIGFLITRKIPNQQNVGIITSSILIFLSTLLNFAMQLAAVRHITKT